MVRFGDIEQIVCFGSGEVLVDAIQYAQELDFETAVVTAPRQSSGTVRGTQFVDLLRSKGIKTVVTANLAEEAVQSLLGEDTVGLSFGAAWIFDESFIDRLNGALVNFHGSRLPQDRGGGGFSWRILRDDRMGYSQAHLIDESIDTGDILMSEEYHFPDECRTPADFDAYVNEKETAFVREFIDRLNAGREFDASAQPAYLSSYWPRLSTSDHGYVDWRWSLEEIVQFIRAFSDPYEGAKTFVRGQEVRLKDCDSLNSDGTFHPFQRGILYRKHNDRAYVATPDGTLIIGCILDENNESVLDDLALGDRFYTPMEQLERAKRTRVFYTPAGRRHEEY